MANPDDGDHEMDEHEDLDENEQDNEADGEQQEQQQCAPAPKKKQKGGKKGRESKKRNRQSRAAKLRAQREQLRVYNAGIAAASKFPRSYALNSLQDMHELRTGHAAERTVPRLDLTKVVNKPSSFDGTTGSFHDWKNEVQMYLRIMNFSSEQEASIVQGYLRGTALAWWIQKLDNMSANGIPPPATFDEFMHYLNERFDHRNPELASRDKLMSLRQNNLSLHQYLSEFESCYAFIPKWDEADKIHRFMFGLKPHYRSKFCVDPATHRWWTSFDSLVAYISAFVSDDPDICEDSLQDMQDDETSSDEDADSIRPREPLLQLANAHGEPVVRSRQILAFCSAEYPKLCLGCYQPGHRVAECTHEVAEGNPPGMLAA